MNFQSLDFEAANTIKTMVRKVVGDYFTTTETKASEYKDLMLAYMLAPVSAFDLSIVNLTDDNGFCFACSIDFEEKEGTILVFEFTLKSAKCYLTDYSCTQVFAEYRFN